MGREAHFYWAERESAAAKVSKRGFLRQAKAELEDVLNG
jgi:hypothetical protein